MILGVRTQILVYSTATSLPVRSLRLDQHEKITSYTTCTTNANHLFVSTFSGLIVKWDWTTGQEIKQWRSSKNLLFISEQTQDQKDLPSSTLLLIHEISGQVRRVTLATFLDSFDDITSEKVVLEEKSLASWIKVLDQGKCLVLYADSKIFLGQATRRSEDSPTAYTWREFAVPKSITSIDARSHSLYTSTNKSRVAVDVVVGCQNGTILIYDDILFRLTSKEKNLGQDDIISCRFHWHRNEVLTVKWSLDGNYLISGGHETVMVIWQLDTGQQQFLPHLSAAIQHLTISETGSAYAVHLADNSVLLLSASELQPTAYISNLILGRRRANERKVKRVPAILDHTDSGAVALAVPADCAVRSSDLANATLLQTYNIRLHQQANRQALVRNNITVLNVNPSGKPVHEPDVIHLDMSHDGKWLATVDEWTPADDDVKALYLADEGSPTLAKETFLKFWIKNESTRSWELATKIQSPHSMRTAPSNSLLDMKANPRRPEFSTIASDGSINIWTPKSRHRNGLPVTDVLGSQLYTWTCTHSVELPVPLRKSIPTTSSLTYSIDGSVLAVSSNKSPFVHFVDPLTGRIQHTQHGSHPGVLSHHAFLNHHLITISKDLRVYNTVSGDLLYALALHSSVSDVRLAANQLDQTFAVVCLLPAIMSREKDGKAKARSQVMVFDLKSATPRFRKIVAGTVEVLLPLPEERGYLLIDDDAEVVYLRRPGSGSARKKVEVPFLKENMEPPRLEDIFGRRSTGSGGEHGGASVDMDMDGDGDERGPVAYGHRAQSSLSDILNNHSTNLPVRELFEKIVAVVKSTRI